MNANAHPDVHSTLTIAGRRLALLDRARIYVCGITPYDVTHLGHAATFVWADVLGRMLHLLDVDAEICRNVTDVDDVLDAAAARAGTDADWYAAVGQFHFETDMGRLHVRAPRYEPRAHRYIRQVVRVAHHLVESGAAYVRDGAVYFRGTDIAERAGIEHEHAVQLATEYDENPHDPAKDHPLDVAVWHACGADRIGWDSPWGPGRPGWHAECVAMALSVFGVGVDLHAGGADLAFPHHTYHAAMAEALTGVTPYARAWMHVGTVTVNGAKMAKSAGNLVLVSGLLSEHSPALIRMLILDRPWHETWDYAQAQLDGAGTRLEALYGAAGRTTRSTPAAEDEVRRALREDLDVPWAVDVAVDSGGSAARRLTTVLGLD